MSDNSLLNPGSGGDRVATDEVTWSSDVAQVQLVKLVRTAGTEGSKTADLDGVDLLNTINTKLGSTPAQDRAAAAAPGAVRLSDGTSFYAGATETTLDAINTKTPALGAAAAAASSPVVLANEQILDQFITGQGSQLAAGNNVILATAGTGSTDCQQYRSVALQVVPAAGTVTAGNITFEGSNNNADWQAVPLYDLGSLTANPITTYALAATTPRYFAGQVIFRYFRARISTGVTGTTTGVQAFTVLRMTPFTAPQQTITQATAANLNATITGTVTASNSAGTAAQGATASGNPVFTGGVAKTAQPTARTDGQIVAPLFDKVGRNVIRQGQVRDLTDLNAQLALSSTTETTLVTAIAAVFNDLQAVEIASTAAFSGSPTGVRVDFRDVTAGTVRFSVSLPSAGGVFNWNRSWMGAELRQATVNTTWTAQIVFVGGTAPAVSSGDIRITAQTVRNI